jgi:Fuc2NAc and GlcNAc transferase
VNYGVIWIVGSTFILAVIATGVMRQYAIRRNLLDVPNVRSSHAYPTPRGGGVAVVLAFFASVLLLASGDHLSVRVAGAFVVGGGAVAFIGFLDDRHPVRASVRLGVHALAAIFAVILLGGIPDTDLANWGLHGSLAAGGIAVLLLVWSANLFNFMDGIDGIAGSEAVFVSGAAALLNWYRHGDSGLTAAMSCLAAANLGFLRWNWPPAAIFMGDVGSGFVGFTIAAFALAASQTDTFPVEVWGILGGCFFVDATVTLISRMLRGYRWYEAHRSHVYQHFARRWKAHLPVTIAVSAINLCWLLPWAWLAIKMPAHARHYMAAALIPLVTIAVVIGAGRRAD